MQCVRIKLQTRSTLHTTLHTEADVETGSTPAAERLEVPLRHPSPITRPGTARVRSPVAQGVVPFGGRNHDFLIRFNDGWDRLDGHLP